MDPALIPSGVSAAALLTAAGAGIAAAIITGLTAVLKRALPVLDEKFSGALIAFVLSLALYALVGIGVGVDSIDEFLTVLVAWLAVATAAVGVDQVVARNALT